MAENPVLAHDSTFFRAIARRMATLPSRGAATPIAAVVRTGLECVSVCPCPCRSSDFRGGSWFLFSARLQLVLSGLLALRRIHISFVVEVTSHFGRQASGWSLCKNYSVEHRSQRIMSG